MFYTFLCILLLAVSSANLIWNFMPTYFNKLDKAFDVFVVITMTTVLTKAFLC